MATVIVPVGANDTPESLAIRYTIGGAAYAPAIVQQNAWFDSETFEPVGVRTLLQPGMGITGAAIPSEWLRAGAQQGGAIAGVPVWVWLAALAALVVLR